LKKQHSTAATGTASSRGLQHQQQCSGGKQWQQQIFMVILLIKLDGIDKKHEWECITHWHMQSIDCNSKIKK